MKLDIHWWATTNNSIVGLIPVNGKTVVIREGHDGRFTGYKADEVKLLYRSIEGDEFRLYAVCRQGDRVEDIRLLNPLFLDLLGINPVEIVNSTTFI